LLSTSKLVFIDRANTFQKKEEGNKKDMKRLKKLKRNDRPLTAREKRELKIYDIPKEAQRYDLFLPLAKLWQGYAARLASQGANFEQKLIKADLHGAMFNSK
jgi:ribonuclease P protein subunit POP4